MSRGGIGTTLDTGPARVGEYPPGHWAWDAHPPATDTDGKQVVYILLEYFRVPAILVGDM